MTQFKVRDNPNLKRDGYSKAVVATDLTLLNEHKRKKQMQNDMAAMNTKINNLESDIGDIKSMLAQLLKK